MSFFVKIRKFRLFLAIPPVFILFFCSLTMWQNNHRFAVYTDTLFRTEVSANTVNLHYTLANPKAYGIEEYNVTLGHVDPKNLQLAAQSTFTWKEELAKIPTSSLNRTNKLTYKILSWYFDTAAEGSPFLLYDEPLGKTLGTQAQLPVLLAEYSFSSIQDIQDYLKILSQIPAYYRELLSFEQTKADAGLFMSQASATNVQKQCSAFSATAENNLLITSFPARLKNIKPALSAKQISALIQKNQDLVLHTVLPSYDALASEIARLQASSKNQKGLCYLPDGRAYYEYLLRSSTGCDLNIAQIHLRLTKQIRQDIQELQAILKTHPEYLSNGANILKQDLNTVTSNPKEIIEELQQNIADDFPPLKDCHCSLKYISTALQEYSSPAFYLTPPLDNFNLNTIYLNSLDNQDPLELYVTLAHEGWPGHLYQNVYSASYLPPVRSLLHFGGFTEGWATYIELMSYRYAGVSDETADIYRLNRSLMLGLSSLLDLDIHYYGYDRKQTADFLSSFGLESSADSLYDLILDAPANYLKYDLGYLSFQDLQAKVRKKEGDEFSLKEFHRRILETGPCPFSVLYDVFDVTQDQ